LDPENLVGDQDKEEMLQFRERNEQIFKKYVFKFSIQMSLQLRLQFLRHATKSDGPPLRLWYGDVGAMSHRLWSLDWKIKSLKSFKVFVQEPVWKMRELWNLRHAKSG